MQDMNGFISDPNVKTLFVSAKLELTSHRTPY